MLRVQMPPGWTAPVRAVRSNPARSATRVRAIASGRRAPLHSFPISRASANAKPRGVLALGAASPLGLSRMSPTSVWSQQAILPTQPARSMSILSGLFQSLHEMVAPGAKTQPQVPSLGASAPAAATPTPKTARQEMTQADIERILESGEHRDWVTHRTPDEDVAKNQPLVFTGKSLSTAPPGTYYGQGLGGLPYGDWHVAALLKQAQAQPRPGKAEEYYSPQDLPADVGRWFHNKTFLAAQAAVKQRKTLAQDKLK